MIGRSLKAFEAIRGRLFSLAGCSPACIDACECTCNTSGAIYDALIQSQPLYCEYNTICTDPMIRKAMNYDASSHVCDTTFGIALLSVYQLCGATNGDCRNGQCVDENCITTVDPACRQVTGVSTVLS